MFAAVCTFVIHCPEDFLLKDEHRVGWLNQDFWGLERIGWIEDGCWQLSWILILESVIEFWKKENKPSYLKRETFAISARENETMSIWQTECLRQSWEEDFVHSWECSVLKHNCLGQVGFALCLGLLPTVWALKIYIGLLQKSFKRGDSSFAVFECDKQKFKTKIQ